MDPKIGIEQTGIKHSVKLLKKILADQMVIYIKTLNFHWNVRGVHFNSLHKLFEGHYTQYAEWVDMVAEHIRILGHDAPGSMKEFIELSDLKEYHGTRLSDKEMLQNLLTDQESIIRSLRDGVDIAMDQDHDVGTSDFFTELLREYEKIAWMTRAHLEK